VYTPTIGVPGVYEVFEWHGYRGASAGAVTASTAVPVKITHAGGDTTVTVNQAVNRGKWNSLGVYSFTKGKTGRVEISNQSPQIVLSDAVSFVFRGATIADWDFSAPVPPQGVRVNPAP
jgi:hypothetical protein